MEGFQALWCPLLRSSTVIKYVFDNFLLSDLLLYKKLTKYTVRFPKVLHKTEVTEFLTFPKILLLSCKLFRNRIALFKTLVSILCKQNLVDYEFQVKRLNFFSKCDFNEFCSEMGQKKISEETLKTDCGPNFAPKMKKKPNEWGLRYSQNVCTK